MMRPFPVLFESQQAFLAAALVIGRTLVLDTPIPITTIVGSQKNEIM